jgi:hypothetical protein
MFAGPYYDGLNTSPKAVFVANVQAAPVVSRREVSARLVHLP